MTTIGWYYLHKNGSLIYKPSPDAITDIRDSDLALCAWPMDPGDRMGAWNIVVEGLALGANEDRVAELANKWQCGDDDAEHYAKILGVTIDRDGDAWCAKQPSFENLQVSDAGFGASKLRALSDLAKVMGLKGGKMWRATFADLCRAKSMVTS